jgi:hypothetical protein
MPTGMHPRGEEQARVVMVLPRDFSSSSCSSSMLVICTGLAIVGVLEVKVPAQPAQKKQKTLLLLVLLVVVLIPLRDATCANAEAEAKVSPWSWSCGRVNHPSARGPSPGLHLEEPMMQDEERQHRNPKFQPNTRRKQTMM